jgi:hypothetical protein
MTLSLGSPCEKTVADPSYLTICFEMFAESRNAWAAPRLSAIV